MGNRVRMAAMAAAMLAVMVGTTPAHASTPMQRLAKRVTQLERANKNRMRENRALQSQLAQDEDALGFTIDMLSCFFVSGSSPADVGTLQVFAVDPSTAPATWIATVDPNCVSTGGPASARARAFRTFFAPKGIR